MSIESNNAVQLALGQLYSELADDATYLAQVGAEKPSYYSSLTSSTSNDNGDSWGIGEFILGCFMIPFALVMLWKNEKKVVTFAKCMDQGRDLVRSADCEDPDDANEFELVHLTGTTVNKLEIVDNEFGITVNNSYRLKRKVEMY